MTADVCVMTVAQGIPQKIKDRFKACAELSAPKASFDVVFLGEGVPLKGLFNKSKFLNSGVKDLSKKGYQCIVQVDVDLIIPPGIIDTALEHSQQPNLIFHNHHRRVREELVPKFPEQYHTVDWGKLFGSLVPENANGAWNSASPETWMKSGGWCELMVNWGREDDTFRYSSSHFGCKFLNYNKFCLLHINHPFRGIDNRKYNKGIEADLRKDNAWPDWLAESRGQ